MVKLAYNNNVSLTAYQLRSEVANDTDVETSGICPGLESHKVKCSKSFVVGSCGDEGHVIDHERCKNEYSLSIEAQNEDLIPA